MDVAQLGLKIDSRQLSRGADELKRFARAGQDADGAARGVAKAAALAVGAVGAMVGALGGASAAIGMARDYSSALAEVSTLLDGNAAEMRALSGAAKELASTYGGSATAQVQAFYQAISAGAGGVKQATGLLDTANRLAIGGVTDVTTAVDGLTTATNAYAAQGLSAAQASDALFVGMRAGKTTISELSGQLGQIVPIASAAGLSFDEVVAGISALTTQGQSTAMATTGLRQAIAAVINPTSQAEKLAARLGLAFDGQALQAEGLAGFLQTVIEKTGGNQKAMAELFGSVEALNAVLAFAGGAGGTFAEILEDMKDKAGATDEAFQKVAQSLDQRLNVAIGKIGNLALEIGEVMLAVAVPAMEAVAAVAQIVADNMDRLVAIGGVLAAVYAGKVAVTLGRTFATAAAGAVRQTIALEMALGATSRSAAVASAGVKLFSGALRTMRAALISTGIGALVVMAGEMVYRFTRLVESAGGFGNAMKLLGEVASAVWEGIGDSAKAIPPALEAVWQTVKAGFWTLISGLQTIWADFLHAMHASLASVDVPGMEDAVNDIGTAAILAGSKVYEFSDNARQASEAADAAAASAKELAAGGFAKVEAAAAKLAAAVTDSTSETEDGTDAANRLNEALGNLGSGTGGASKAAKKLKEVKDAATGFREAMKDAAFTAEEWGKEKAQILISGIDGISNAFGDFVSRGFTDFKDFASSILKSFQGMISQMVAMAVKNRIMISLGFGGVSGAAGGGMSFGGLLGGGAGGAAGGGGGFGLTSLLGGIGSSFKALGSIFGIGSTTMGSLGGFGAALGAAIPAIGILAVGISALIGKTTELDRGIRVTVNGMDALVQTFRRTETSRLFGLLKSKKTRLGTAPDEVADPVMEAISDIQNGVIDMAASLDIGARAFAGFSTVINVSTKGMSQEDAAKAVQDALKGMADEMAEMALHGHDVIRAGEGASDALSRLAGALSATQTVFDTLGHTMFDVSIAGADMASQLVDLFGGIDAFNNATTTYFNAFYSETERVAISVRQATAALDQFGIALPQSRAQYRQLVESIDLTSERGRELYATLLGLAGVMDRVLPAVQSFTQMISGLVGESTSIIDVMISEANDMAREAAQASANWYRAADSLRDLVRDLKSTETGTGAMQLGASSSAMQKAFSAAIGGDAEAAQQFPQLARTFLQVAETQASSAVEFRRAQARVLNQSKTLAGVAEIEGFNKTVLERLYETQISVLTELKDYLTGADAIDAQVIAGFEGQLGSLEEAIKSAEMFSYAYLKERLKVTVDLLPQANIPADVRKLLATAANGIKSTIEFAVRADGLTPDLRWIALTGSSEHIASLQFAIKKGLPADLRKLAVTEVMRLDRALNFTVGKALPADLKRLALTEYAEVSRSLRVALGASDRTAIKVALAKSDTVRRTFTAAFDMGALSPEQRSLLTAINGRTVGNITLAGGFVFDPSTGFRNWFEIATKAKIGTPMEQLRAALDRLRAAVLSEKAYVPSVPPPAPAPTPAPAKPAPTKPKYSASNFQVSEGLVAYTDTVDRIGATLYKQGYTVRGPLGGTRTFDTATAAQKTIADAVAGRIPAFATGGTHRGGLARVGENDMELVAPSRIYSPSETRQMLDNRAVVDELRAMRKENRELRDTMEQFEREAFRDRRKMRKILEQAEVIGLPVRNPDDGTPLETTT